MTGVCECMQRSAEHALTDSFTHDPLLSPPPRKLSRKQQSLMLSYAEEETDVPGTVNGVTMPTGQTTAHPRMYFVCFVLFMSHLSCFFIKKKERMNHTQSQPSHKTTHGTIMQIHSQL